MVQRLLIVRLLTVVALAFAAGCGKQATDVSLPAGSGPLERPAASDDAISAVATATNNFAVNLYRRLAATEGNIFFSPSSVTAAMSMVGAGARGTTAQEMAGVLGVDVVLEPAHAALGALLFDVSAAGRTEGGALAIANALWVQKEYPFEDSFLKLLESDYGASVGEANFESDAEAVRRRINAWVEQSTCGLIRELVGTGDLGEMTRLVAANAIYFLGEWHEKFMEESTDLEARFTRADGTTVQTPLMAQTEPFPYLRGDGFQVLELPYRGDRLAMLILLPDRHDGLPALEAQVTAAQIADWAAALRKREVFLQLPRFSLEYGCSLADHLKALGMASAFGTDADFTGMASTRALFLSAVLHKACITVNEKGTEAAAATAAVVSEMAVREPPPRFQADHPFLFCIRDRTTGLFLFLGRLMDPSQTRE